MNHLHKLLIVLILLSACDKEEKNTHKMAGIYTVESIVVDYYQNGAIDSTITDNNPGAIALYDNGSDTYNRLVNTMSYEPLSWQANQVGGIYIVQWYTTARGKPKTVSFFSRDDYYTHFVTYTIQNAKRNGSMDWIYVKTDSNGVIEWTETLKMKRQK